MRALTKKTLFLVSLATASLDDICSSHDPSSYYSQFTQHCSKFPPTALLNFACDWLALDRDISFGRLNSHNV